MANVILKMYPAVLCDAKDPAGWVVDGCALIHALQWPKVGTIDQIFSDYMRAVQRRMEPGLPMCVVFDSYTMHTTKDQTQKRRRLTKSCPDILLDYHTQVPTNQKTSCATSETSNL